MNNVKEKIENAVLTTAVKATISACDAADKVAESKTFTKVVNFSAKVMSHKACRVMLAIPMAVSMLTLQVCAAGGSGSDTANSILDEIMKYLSAGVIALGALMAVLGGVQLGQGFKDENADGKVRGFNTLIGGAIIGAVGVIIQNVDISFNA